MYALEHVRQPGPPSEVNWWRGGVKTSVRRGEEEKAKVGSAGQPSATEAAHRREIARAIGYRKPTQRTAGDDALSVVC